MKQSKAPLWRKSMLQCLNMYEIRELLFEIQDNGDCYGYDTDEKGYYLEYKEQFDELSDGASQLLDAIEESDYSRGNDISLFDLWDDMTVALLGKTESVLGFDVVQEDYFKMINNFDEEFAEGEAVKRIERMTKSDLIKAFRKVMVTLVLFFDIKAAHDCLTSIVEELDERAAIFQNKSREIDRLYSDLTGKNGEEFDRLVETLPQRMWVE